MKNISYKNRYGYIIILCFAIFLLFSCKVDKNTLPSGKPDKVLSKELYSKAKSQYNDIQNFYFGYAIVKNKKAYGLINYEGKEVLGCVYDTIFNFNSEMKILKRKTKYGIVAYNGDNISDCIYDNFKNFGHDTTLIVMSKGTKWGVLDINGDIVIPIKCDNISNIEDSHVIIRNKGKYGMLNREGTQILGCMYDTILDHYCNTKISLYALNNRIGIINSKNKVVTGCDFNCRFIASGKIAIIDKPQNGYIKLEKYTMNGNTTSVFGMANCETGKTIIPFEYDDLGHYSEGLIAAKKNKKCGYIDIHNKIVLPFIYDNGYDFSEGIAAVEKETGEYGYIIFGRIPLSKCGFINKQGEEVIPFKFNMQIISPIFKEGLAPIGISSSNLLGLKIGYINKIGSFVIKPIFDGAEPFKHGAGVVQIDNKYGVVDKAGKYIINCLYDWIDINNKNISARKDDKIDLFKFDGTPIH